MTDWTPEWTPENHPDVKRMSSGLLRLCNCDLCLFERLRRRRMILDAFRDMKWVRNG